MITVYTTGHACMRCRWTIRRLDDLGIRHRVVDLTNPANAEARTYVTDDLGYTEAPVVVVDDHDHWCGFDPDRLSALTTHREAS
ncbi:glutaredoxin family protein [Microbacterium aurum]